MKKNELTTLKTRQHAFMPRHVHIAAKKRKWTNNHKTETQKDWEKERTLIESVEKAKEQLVRAKSCFGQAHNKEAHKNRNNMQAIAVHKGVGVWMSMHIVKDSGFSKLSLAPKTCEAESPTSPAIGECRMFAKYNWRETWVSDLIADETTDESSSGFVTLWKSYSPQKMSAWWMKSLMKTWRFRATCHPYS